MVKQILCSLLVVVALGATPTLAQTPDINALKDKAEQGDAEAQLALGAAYYNGEGVAEDDKEAVRWYRKAAEQGDAGAQSFLGDAYYDGEGVTKDDAEAVKWWRKAAEQGDAPAQGGLIFAYYNGVGVAKDYVESYKWLNLGGVGHKETSDMRDGIEKMMTREQIAEGRRRAREWLEKHHKP